MLKRGSSGPEVEDLQRKLLANKINPGPVDGLFGPKTEDAVRRFQEMHDLQVDGIVGPKTRGAFEVAAAKSASDSAGKQAGAADARAKAAQERADAAKRSSKQQASTDATSREAEAKKSVDKAGGIFSRVFKRGSDDK